jgi:hypothetical protein
MFVCPGRSEAEGRDPYSRTVRFYVLTLRSMGPGLALRAPRDTQ